MCCYRRLEVIILPLVIFGIFNSNLKLLLNPLFLKIQ